MSRRERILEALQTSQVSLFSESDEEIIVVAYDVRIDQMVLVSSAREGVIGSPWPLIELRY